MLPGRGCNLDFWLEVQAAERVTPQTYKKLGALLSPAAPTMAARFAPPLLPACLTPDEVLASIVRPGGILDASVRQRS